MPRFNPAVSFAVLGAALLLAGCSGGSLNFPGFSQPEPQPVAPAPVAALPPAFPAKDMVGRWGLAAYHNAEDRERTEAAARGQCKQPYVISAGATGGVLMHLADQPQAEELRLKGAPGGKTFIGPEGEAGGMQDREVVSFDGRVMQLRWIDPEVQGRYGTMVYVRCGAEGAKPTPAKRKPRAAAPRPAAAPVAPVPR
jgi:hypothetical protein